MPAIVYLDVEDEITSAATRIRTAAESRVALVLPLGSRLATSRINFRLLAREAMVNGRRLDIIAPDASARALAASAGLPVYGSIAEYEGALEVPEEAGGAPQQAGSTAKPRAEPARDPARTRATYLAEPADPGGGRDVEPFEDEPMGRRRGGPRIARAPRRRRLGTGALVGLGILVVAVVIAAGAAFVFLPSADITITPRVEAIGPIPLTVRADPAVTAVDTANREIPAQTLDLAVESSGEFAATGKRVVEVKATGGVRLMNCDNSASYTIPRGTVLRTSGGIGFATDEAVFLPVAIITPSLQLQCQTSEVAVTALAAGPDGNVPAGAIKVVPARYNRLLVRVTNRAATSGGKRDEFLVVAQKDVDGAIEQLRKGLDTQFATELADPTKAPPGATVFPETATLDDPAPDVDPATLVGKEVPTFTLRMTATGHVLAVDASPVMAIAEARLRDSVTAGYDLVAGSIAVTVGEGTVAGGVVTIPVEGTAKQVRQLDAAALKRQVLGLATSEAKARLAQYGAVTLTVWPDWVSGVPTLEQRVTLTVAPPFDPSPAATPTPKPTAEPTATPLDQASASPSGSPRGSEPVPSG